FAGGTTGSRRESESVVGSHVWQPSVGEKSVGVFSPSYSAAHRESQLSPAQNLNTGADEGYEVEPDAA
ncbi:hypothetical protein A2U01_0089148, partial [Trifolium medium]|nr:hypothetical protein [Trifolium medium]